MSDPSGTSKAREHSSAVLGQELTLSLRRNDAVPLYRQLYKLLQRAILDGRLPPGARLPASRVLARDLGISRTTTAMAYDQLQAEGYLQTRRGAGTFVCTDLPDVSPVRAENTSPRRFTAVPSFSKRTQALLLHNRGSSRNDATRRLPLSPGTPAHDAFPFPLWARITARLWRDPPASWVAEGDAFGYFPLREAIAGYLRAARSVRARAEQIMIVSGSQQAIDICARTLLDPGDTAIVENTAYQGTIRALTGAGARPLPAVCDDQGLCVGQWPETGNIHLVCVTPSSLYPLGTAMPLSRRLALLDWAGKNNAWIIEDDYDADFSLSGRGIAAMQGLDEDGRVLYVGTFSQALFPSLRLGYVVVPDKLTDAFRALRGASDGHSPMLAQPVLAEFMTQGHFSAHRRRMRLLYRNRRQALLTAISRHGKGILHASDRGAGLHVIAESLLAHMDENAIARSAGDIGIGIRDLSGFIMPPATGDPAPTPPKGLLIGFGGQNEEALEHAINRLCRHLRQCPRTELRKK